MVGEANTLGSDATRRIVADWNGDFSWHAAALDQAAASLAVTELCSADRPDNFVVGLPSNWTPRLFLRNIYELRQSAGVVNQRSTHEKEELYVPLPW